jgi:uncharacterized protein (TIGR00661 family)
MKIIYGIQATGNGHISRSRELVKALKREGHDVHCIISGRPADQLWDMEAFEPYSVLRGLTLITERGEIKYIKTTLQLHILQFIKDVRRLDLSEYDLVITDFEPVTAYAAIFQKRESLGVGNQYAFAYDVPFPKHKMISAMGLKRFAPASVNIGLHWHHFDAPILPPIIPLKHQAGQVKAEKDKIVVYLPFEEMEEVIDLLKHFPQKDFYFYCGIKVAEDMGHIHLRPFSRDGFLYDLHSCEGVISNGGFQLPSEALHLGKKVLSRPVIGQAEQIANGLALEQLKLGSVMHSLDKNCLGEWLKKEPIAAQNYPDVASAVAKWISAGKYGNPKSLAEKLWVR